jgi:hypothetical protein
MIAAAKSPNASNAFAVIRKFEPSRIERELLAQVFDVVTHRTSDHPSADDPVGAAMVGAVGRVNDGRSYGGVEPKSASTKLERQERAA